jgi:hypothetical protein
MAHHQGEVCTFLSFASPPARPHGHDAAAGIDSRPCCSGATICCCRSVSPRRRRVYPRNSRRRSPMPARAIARSEGPNTRVFTNAHTPRARGAPASRNGRLPRGPFTAAGGGYSRWTGPLRFRAGPKIRRATAGELLSHLRPRCSHRRVLVRRSPADAKAGDELQKTMYISGAGLSSWRRDVRHRSNAVTSRSAVSPEDDDIELRAFSITKPRGAHPPSRTIELRRVPPKVVLRTRRRPDAGFIPAFSNLFVANTARAGSGRRILLHPVARGPRANSPPWKMLT